MPHSETLLHFLDFDFQWLDEPADAASFDAMAVVSAVRLRELTEEIESVLAWAHATFPGTCAPLEEGGSWHCDIGWIMTDHATGSAAFDIANSKLLDESSGIGLKDLAAAFKAVEVEIFITLVGGSAFTAALRERFNI
jgi:hypothetical protein